jgi:hypothetical protein
LKPYQITIRSTAGTTQYTGIYCSSIDATIAAMDHAPAGASISVKPMVQA